MEAALDLARAGFRVFPVMAGGKRPLTEHGFHDATTDPPQIQRWWDQSPAANVGIATGQGFMVLDVDPRHGGAEALAALEATHGKMPPTCEAITGGGGRHLYFSLPEGTRLPNSANKLGAGLDIRGDGGYVVASPSVHESGASYAWRDSRGLSYPLAPAPEWLLKLLIQSRAARKRKRKDPGVAAGGAGRRFRQGERNTSLTSLAGSMRRAGMGQEAIEAALLVENQEHCAPPLDDGEVRKIAASIASYPPGVEDRHLTDTWLAEKVVEKHGLDLKHIGIWNKWIWWDGCRWRMDDAAELQRRVKATIRELHVGAAQAGDKELASFCIKAESAHKRNAAAGLMRFEKAVAIDHRDLDRNPWLLNVANGTLDLRTGKLGPYRRKDLLTKLVEVNYESGATCPTWERFLARVLDDDRELIDFLRRAVGYSLTGLVTEQVLFFLYGKGSNGKSTFTVVLLELAGDYAKQAAPGLLLAKRGEAHPTEQADLAGARLVVSQEVDQGRSMAEGTVKQLTGGDRVKARRMREDFWEFSPTHKLWLCANHKPMVRGTDWAIWRRILLVPFTVTIPEEEKDGALPEKLKKELPGILAWAVQGCLEWQATGLKPPRMVQAATAAYRQEMDTIGEFIADRCILDPNARTPAERLFNEYRTWAEAAGERPESQKALGLHLGEREGLSKGKSGGKIVWRGIRLRSAKTSTPSDAGKPQNGEDGEDRGQLPVSPPCAAATQENPKKGQHPPHPPSRGVGWPLPAGGVTP